MDKWGYNHLIEQKTLREKEKLLVTSNFSFSHNVFKSCLLLMRQTQYLWSKGLKILKLCIPDYIKSHCSLVYVTMPKVINISKINLGRIQKGVKLRLNTYHNILTLSQTTNFRLFQTQRVCRRQFHI